MSEIRWVYCKKLKKEAIGFLEPPFPGDLGKNIFENISVEAWGLWTSRQTMFINEYRLNLADKNAREFLKEQMKIFLFEEGDILPSGYSPPSQN